MSIFDKARTDAKAALMEKSKSGDLFEKTPEIHKIEILAV